MAKKSASKLAPKGIITDRWTYGKALGGKSVFRERIAEIQGCHPLKAALFEGGTLEGGTLQRINLRMARPHAKC